MGLGPVLWIGRTATGRSYFSRANSNCGTANCSRRFQNCWWRPNLDRFARCGGLFFGGLYPWGGFLGPKHHFPFRLCSRIARGRSGINTRATTPPPFPFFLSSFPYFLVSTCSLSRSL